ncbi:MAG: DUF4389 domain-containing protein [Gammaproteobacteria bacterium]|nr:DUF4389 domain-containing protein [Gammaproteobacteria bacterium]
MSDDVKDNIRETKTWMRALYMLLFAIIYAVTEIIITAVVVFQFLLVLFTGKTNPKLLQFGQSLSTFIYQILQYLTFNSETQPYPYGEWPKGAPTSSAARKTKKTNVVAKKKAE